MTFYRVRPILAWWFPFFVLIAVSLSMAFVAHLAPVESFLDAGLFGWLTVGDLLVPFLGIVLGFVTVLFLRRGNRTLEAFLEGIPGGAILLDFLKSLRESVHVVRRMANALKFYGVDFPWELVKTLPERAPVDSQPGIYADGFAAAAIETFLRSFRERLTACRSEVHDMVAVVEKMVWKLEDPSRLEKILRETEEEKRVERCLSEVMTDVEEKLALDSRRSLRRVQVQVSEVFMWLHDERLEPNGVRLPKEGGSRTALLLLAWLLLRSGHLEGEVFGARFRAGDVKLLAELLEPHSTFKLWRFNNELRAKLGQIEDLVKSLGEVAELYNLASVDKKELARTLLGQHAWKLVEACAREIARLKFTQRRQAPAAFEQHQADLQALIDCVEIHMVGTLHPEGRSLLRSCLEGKDPAQQAADCMDVVERSFGGLGEADLAEVLVILYRGYVATSKVPEHLAAGVAWVLFVSGRLHPEDIAELGLEGVEKILHDCGTFSHESFREELHKELERRRKARQEAAAERQKQLEMKRRQLEIQQREQERQRRIEEEQKERQRRELRTCHEIVETMASVIGSHGRHVPAASCRKAIARSLVEVEGEESRIDACARALAPGCALPENILVLLYHARDGEVGAPYWPPPDGGLGALAELLVENAHLAGGWSAADVEQLLRPLETFAPADFLTELHRLGELRRALDAYMQCLAERGLAPPDTRVDLLATLAACHVPLPTRAASFTGVGDAGLVFTMLKYLGLRALRERLSEKGVAVDDAELPGHVLLSQIFFAFTAGFPRDVLRREAIKREAAIELGGTLERVVKGKGKKISAPIGVLIAWACLELELGFGDLTTLITGWEKTVRACRRESLQRELDALQQALSRGLWLNSREKLINRIFTAEAEESLDQVREKISESTHILDAYFSRLELEMVEKLRRKTKPIPYLLAIRAGAGPVISLINCLVPAPDAEALKKELERVDIDPKKYNFKRYTNDTRLGTVPPGMSFEDFCKGFKQDFEKAVAEQDALLRASKKHPRSPIVRHRVEEYELLLHPLVADPLDPFFFGPPPGGQKASERLGTFLGFG